MQMYLKYDWSLLRTFNAPTSFPNLALLAVLLRQVMSILVEQMKNYFLLSVKKQQKQKQKNPHFCKDGVSL